MVFVYSRNGKLLAVPLTLTDLGFLFAVSSIVLLMTVELFSAKYGQISLKIDKRKLKIAAYIAGFFFIFIFILIVISTV